MNRLVIFGWHNVRPTWCFPARPGAGETGMRRQFEFLARVANVVDLPEAVACLADGRPLPPRAAAITFDDGYRDNLELAVPMLEKLGLPATFFLVPDMLSGLVEPWWERLGWAVAGTRRVSLTWRGDRLDLGAAARAATYEGLLGHMKTLDEDQRQAAVTELVESLGPVEGGPFPSLMMRWDDARRLVERGFTVGSHSLRHAILSNQSPADQKQDLLEARCRIEEILGVPADVLAYPNGSPADFSEATVAAAQSAGYRAAVTTIDGVNSGGTPPHEMRRYLVYPEWGVRGFGVVARHGLREARRVARQLGPGRYRQLR